MKIIGYKLVDKIILFLSKIGILPPTGMEDGGLVQHHDESKIDFITRVLSHHNIDLTHESPEKSPPSAPEHI